MVSEKIEVLHVPCELCNKKVRRSEVEKVMETIFPRATLIYVPVVRSAIGMQKQGLDVSSEMARG